MWVVDNAILEMRLMANYTSQDGLKLICGDQTRLLKIAGGFLPVLTGTTSIKSRELAYSLCSHQDAIAEAHNKYIQSGFTFVFIFPE